MCQQQLVSDTDALLNSDTNKVFLARYNAPCDVTKINRFAIFAISCLIEAAKSLVKSKTSPTSVDSSKCLRNYVESPASHHLSLIKSGK